MLHQHTRPFALGDCGIAPEEGYSILPGLARPYSRGTLSLASADSRAAPIIDPAYYADQRDLDALVESVDICRSIGEDAAYADLRVEEVFPGPTTRSRTAVAEFVRRCTHTFFHPTSTCRMGADEDAVVDPELRVNGIAGLRVADASVMPQITSANTNAPSLLIGWRCAEMIAAGTSA
jgi:choline dehydrogenase